MVVECRGELYAASRYVSHRALRDQAVALVASCDVITAYAGLSGSSPTWSLINVPQGRSRVQDEHVEAPKHVHRILGIIRAFQSCGKTEVLLETIELRRG